MAPHTPEMKFDHFLCLHCGACVGTCPANAIFLYESHIAVRGACEDCGLCARVCPVGAIGASGDEV